MLKEKASKEDQEVFDSLEAMELSYNDMKAFLGTIMGHSAFAAHAMARALRGGFQLDEKEKYAFIMLVYMIKQFGEAVEAKKRGEKLDKTVTKHVNNVNWKWDDPKQWEKKLAYFSKMFYEQCKEEGLYDEETSLPPQDTSKVKIKIK